jgi:hypothetical protein
MSTFHYSGEPYYDIAQVCVGGHMVNYHSLETPQHDKPFCPSCGRPTTKECQNCHAQIQGEYQVPNSTAVFVGFSAPERGPNFCHACGSSYPWTEEAIESAQLLAEELDMLDEPDRQALAMLIPDLVHEGPRTAAATVRFRRLVAKAGEAVPGLMKDLLVNVAAESARRALWGP